MKLIPRYKVPVGWRNESHRHYLAAKGIKTVSRYSYFADQKLKTPTQKQEVKPVSFVINAPKKGSTKKRGGAGQEVRPPTAKNYAQALNLLGEQAEEKAAEKDTFGLAKTAIEEGRFEKQIPILDNYGRPIKYADIGGLLKSDALSVSEKNAIRAQLKSKAVEMAKEGIPLSALQKRLIAKEEQKMFGVIPVAGETEKRIAAVEAEKKEELKTEGQKAVKKKLEQVEETFLTGIEGLPGATFAGIEDVYKEGAETTTVTPFGVSAGLGSKKEFVGLSGQIDALENSPFEKTNIFIGNEEDGTFRFMGNEEKPVEGRFGKEQMDINGGVSGIFDSFLGVQPAGPSNQVVQDARGRMVDKQTLIDEVNSLHAAKKQLGKVDLEWYKRGDEAFKKGDREGVINAVNNLKGEEDMLRDRWTLVAQTHADVRSQMNRALLFQEKDSLLGQGGGGKLADQTKKLNEVKSELRVAADKVAARRKLLEFRMARMDATVPAETSVPRSVRVVDENRENDILDSLKNPVKATQDMFRGA